MTKILITGGAGFIGYHLACELSSNEKNEVHIVDNFSRAVKDKHLQILLEKPNVKAYEIDLLDINEIATLESDYDYIYHLAAVIGVKHVLNRPNDVLRNNVILLINMLDFAKRCRGLKRFLFASTSEVYAGTLRYFSLSIPTSENTPLAVNALEEPRTSYMLSKIYGEALCHHSGVPYTIFRPHNFYGPRMGMSHVIPELAKKAYNTTDGSSIEVFSVAHKRTFCYIEDAVKSLMLIAENPECQGSIFNIGNQEPEVSIGELAEVVIKVIGKNLSIEAKEPTSGSPSRRCPDISRIVEATGFKPRVSLTEGITKTVNWYIDNIFAGNDESAN